MKINRLMQTVFVSGCVCVAVPAFAGAAPSAGVSSSPAASALPSMPQCGGDDSEDDDDGDDNEGETRLCGGDSGEDDDDGDDNEGETRLCGGDSGEDDDGDDGDDKEGGETRTLSL